ncbi:hypothetical protein FOCC_FOCC012281 [Frankliniella occidentalis]|uniref:Uncharacterized protein LOC113210619 n=1 Tax=Frankliniella occidentalis TaxID=133901 RepID=A0A9C6XQT8_FRAOC|nr:uncharacterized protein LOC113210619 [Frankliniella occidentalis]KAE8742195.1 hypothetical protein FOCC_FOCC012281 [Frankliniella occidentalis]
MPPPEVFRNVSPATVPALELLLISGYDSSSVPDWRMKYVFKVPSDVDELVPALRDLVLRAPKQLHVGLRHFNEHVVEEAVECQIFLRHSADESECALCAEVAATLGSYRGWPVPVEKCEVFE